MLLIGPSTPNQQQRTAGEHNNEYLLVVVLQIKLLMSLRIAIKNKERK
jgi:hypothetical protein